MTIEMLNWTKGMIFDDIILQDFDDTIDIK